MKRLTQGLAILLATAGIAPLAQAQNADMLSLGLGYYDIGDDDGAADFRVEYRPGYSLWLDDLHTFIGAEVTSDMSVWAGGGFLYDWEMAPNWILTPSVGVGLYTDGDSDLDLGHPIEFRSQLELGYQFTDSAQRVGVSFGHLSNASLDEDNPGTEVLNLYYHFPI